MRAYWESVRQEARIILRTIKALSLANGGEAAKKELDRLRLQAYPPDEEDDGEFNEDKAKELKRFMIGQGL
jgi:hypothetical protein